MPSRDGEESPPDRSRTFDPIIEAGPDRGQAGRRSSSRVLGIVAAVAAMIVAGAAGWRTWQVHRYREAMSGIESEMAAGRYARAIHDLTAGLRTSLDPDRSRYLIGVCEQTRGRTPEAEAAWSSVAVDSPYFGRAVLGRTELLIGRGRLAEAEALIRRAAEAQGDAEGSGLWMLLVPTLVEEGRSDEAAHMIERRWRHLRSTGEGGSEQAVNLARLHMELRWDVPAVEKVQTYLEQAGRLAPDDDRVWLGRANLALRTGSVDEATEWIDRCLKARPDDPAVWRARLDTELAAGRVGGAREAMRHLPASGFAPAQIHRWAARVSAIEGDATRERKELEAALAEEPDDLASLDRLDAIDPGKPGRQVRRAEVARDRSRYQALYRRNQPSRDAEEIARLAVHLGHRFEASVYLSFALVDAPGRADLAAERHRLDNARGPLIAGTLLDRVESRPSPVRR